MPSLQIVANPPGPFLAAEDALIERAQTDVSALEELSPESALVLSNFDPDHPPAMNALASSPIPLKVSWGRVPR